MAQQTAVEWFEKNISKFISYHYEKAYEEHNEVSRIFQQAKEMEKEQIVNADLNATIRTAKGFNADVYVTRVKELAEQYYNETYNK